MPKYRVTLKEVVLHELFVDAESESEAREIAEGRGIESATEVQDGGWVETGEVEEYDGTISWGELAQLTHKTQVERFGWCICEGTDGEGQLAEDCPRNEVAS